MTTTPGLEIETREADGVTLLNPRGYIDAHTVSLLDQEIAKAILARRFKIVLNCAGLAYIASAGLGAIMGAIGELRRNGGDLRLSDASEAVQHILDVLGLSRLYPVFPSEQEAVTSFRAETAQG